MTYSQDNHVRNLLLIALLSLVTQLSAQTSHPKVNVSDPTLDFIENRGQMPQGIRYKCGLDAFTTVYVHETSLRYVIFEEQELDLRKRQPDHNSPSSSASEEKDHTSCGHNHDPESPSAHTKSQTTKGHAYEVKFLNANSQAQPVGVNKKPLYLNYIRGNNAQYRFPKVPIYSEVLTNEIYEGIALKAHSIDGHFKYDLILRPQADPTQIKLSYEGTDNLLLDKGDLVISTSIKEVRELKPYAYQEYNGIRIQIPCNYVLDGNQVSFDFPNGYDKTKELVIDPTVICSTVSGSVGGEIFGHTATYDREGNIYLGGIAFGPGIPVTNGAFDETHNGGSTDIAITKFNPTGTTAIYSTFIGGRGTDQPHSMIVDNKEQLCIFGISSSSDYPTTDNAFQNNLRGGFDIIVTKLNKDGSDLIGSTFVGGNQNDGGPSQFSPTGYYNGDQYRGEIILDQNDFIYVATMSNSMDFPVTQDAYQSSLNGGINNGNQDAVIFKMNPDLSTMVWSTLLGGSGRDIAKGIRVDRWEDVYVVGGTASDIDSDVKGGYMQNYPGGQGSAFVAHITNQGRTLGHLTYFGTDSSDEGYLIDLDSGGNPVICGLTQGVIPTTLGAYSSNPEAQQFICSFSATLSDLRYNSLIGKEQGFGTDFCPIAFMVDKCNFIYVSGYNAESDLPVTSDAYESNPVRSFAESFYLAVLEPFAADLSYATYFGDANHVDGGTSRFDPAGIVTQGVCSCPNSILKTTPGAYREVQRARCDMGVFKMDFDRNTVTSSITTTQSSSGCPPYTFDFEYSGQDATSFRWELGDGAVITSPSFSYTYQSPGRYTVKLVSSNPNSCNLSDTSYYKITVVGNTNKTEVLLCDPIIPVFLDVTTENANYRWENGFYGSTLKVEEEGTYWVDINIDGCNQRDSFVVKKALPFEISLGQDTIVCQAEEMVIGLPKETDHRYSWNTGEVESRIEVTESGEYSLNSINENGCSNADTVSVEFLRLASPDLGPDAVLCKGDSLILDATSYGSTFLWQDGSTEPQLIADAADTYILEVGKDNCILKDTIEIEKSTLTLLLPQDTILCDETEYQVTSTGTAIENHQWSTSETSAAILITQDGNYILQVTDSYGCETSDSVGVTFKQSPDIYLPTDTSFCAGEYLILDLPLGNYQYLWQDGSTDASLDVTEEGTYAVTASLEECSILKSVEVTTNSIPIIDLGPDNNYCNEDEIQLTLPTGLTFQEIEWNDNTSELFLDVTADGLYWANVTNESGCTYRDSIMVTLLYTDPFEQEDILRCIDQSVNLDLSMITDDIAWSNGTNGTSFSTDQVGEFWFELDNDGCTDRDTFFISVAPIPDINFNLDDVQCYGACDGKAEALFSDVGTSLAWKNQGLEALIEDLCAGEYTLVATDSIGCEYESMVTITEPEELTYSINDVICADSLQGYIQLENIAGGTSPYTYWVDGISSDPLISNMPEGTYQIEIRDANGCQKIENITLSKPPSFIIDAGEDMDIILSESANLSAAVVGVNASIISWTPKSGIECDTCLQTLVTPSESTEYALEVLDLETGCTYRDLVYIDVESDLRIFYPNSMEKNGDGQNEYFTLFGNRLVDQIDFLRVYDKWGNLVFEAENFPVNEPELGWDGRFGNGNAEPGVYTFISAVRGKTGEVEEFAGTLTLFR